MRPAWGRKFRQLGGLRLNGDAARALSQVPRRRHENGTIVVPSMLDGTD